MVSMVYHRDVKLFDPACCTFATPSTTNTATRPNLPPRGGRTERTIPVVEGEAINPLRAGQLRKLLYDKFGPSEAERAMLESWCQAPLTPGAPLPNEDQSSLTPGPWPLGRSQPHWAQSLHDHDRLEREWQADLGICCDGRLANSYSSASPTHLPRSCTHLRTNI
jgi:hypothetical protein